ncbi:hypothetical protein P1P75_41810 [Streptomyces sp. ID05-39B]|uniref:hypothetical protein n=1 Tax=Streptomyces sp. ID05-39B TaxID=3028664 RepID=UPI0029A6AF6E|nr:hypothetical protein [Streptomyces sp. ID05-39B]MDX3532758.1 hypothetical protein [Streptomyces sp. ID05-39B]
MGTGVGHAKGVGPDAEGVGPDDGFGFTSRNTASAWSVAESGTCRLADWSSPRTRYVVAAAFFGNLHVNA